MLSIKQILKNTIVNILVKKHRRQPESVCRYRSCILPAAEYGSVGDEAMVIALIDLLRANKNRISIIDYCPTDEWSAVCKNLIQDHHRLPRRIWEWDSFLRFLSEQDMFYINGADVLDGKYSVEDSLARLRYASLARELGIRVVITGFSFNKTPPPSIVNYFKKMPEGILFFCRDVYSLERFVKLTGRHAKQVADLAFLLEPDEQSHYIELIKSWISTKRRDGKFIFGLTPNVLFKKNSIDQEATHYANILIKLNKKYPSSFLLIPHDYRGTPSDLDFIRVIGEASKDLDLLLVDKLCSAKELKAIAPLLDLSITGRMHFAIACLSSGVPVCGISYQDKFEGVFTMLEMSEFLIESRQIANTEIVVEKITKMINTIVFQRRRICEKLPDICLMARNNLWIA